jgi:hydroxymethylglutaryl-CoA synthase
MTLASFKIPLQKMGWKGVPGEQVAVKMVEAQRFAELDQYRATTHNKGIMNGIDAVALALGQDWRAIESAAHSFASLDKSKGYKPLTKYRVNGGFFEGKLELPMSIGTKGGAIQSNPSY